MTKPALDPFDNQLTKLLKDVQILTGVPSVEVATTGFIAGMIFRALRLLQRTVEATREVQGSHDGLVRTEDVIGEPLFNAPNLARLRSTFENLSNQQQYPDLFAALEHERQAAFNPNDLGQERAIWRLQVGWKYLRAVVKHNQFNLPVLNEQLGGILQQAPSASKYQRLLDGLEGLLPDDAFDAQKLIAWSKSRFVGQLQAQIQELGHIDAASQRQLEARFKEALESAIIGEDGALPAALERVKEKRLEALNEQLEQAQQELSKLEASETDETNTAETNTAETKAEAIKAKQAQIDALKDDITRVSEVKVEP